MSKVIDIKQSLSFKKSTKGFCTHKHVTVDEENRCVECSDCGIVVSAYDFLVKLAYKEASSFDRLNAIEAELSKKEKRYKFLVKEIDRLSLLRKKLNTISNK